MGYQISTIESGLLSIAVLAAASLLALLVHRLVYALAKRFVAKTATKLDDSIVRNSNAPTRLIFVLIGISMSMPFVHLPQALSNGIYRLIGIGVIAGIAWLIIGFINVLSDLMIERYDIHVSDNLTARRVQTQVHLLRRIVVAVVIIVALSAALMTIPEIRGIGAGLFASAGIAGLVVGMAARPTLSNLIAGVQLALTEPIRIEDVVIVEGEWGWIEEIRPTYVVVRIWDLRRLVVPTTYFMEQPFQNWTRKTADLLGTVFVYTDYSIPVDDVRKQLQSILKSSELWDGKVCVLQVTDATDHAIQLRALFSASDSGKRWDLSCEVREKLIQYLQERYPGSLPRARAELFSQGGEVVRHGRRAKST